MFYPLDGPSVQDELSISTQQELKVGASPLSERKVITVQPKDGKVYVSFVNGEDGFLCFKNGIYTFEASDKQPVYIKAESGTVAVVVAERA